MATMSFKLHFKIRMCDHLEISARSGKKVTGDGCFERKRTCIVKYSLVAAFDKFTGATVNVESLKLGFLGHDLLVQKDFPVTIN